MTATNIYKKYTSIYGLLNEAYLDFFIIITSLSSFLVRSTASEVHSTKTFLKVTTLKHRISTLCLTMSHYKHTSIHFAISIYEILVFDIITWYI